MSLTITARRELTPFEGRVATVLEIAVWLAACWVVVQSRMDAPTALVLLVALVLIGFRDATAWYANRFPPRTGPAALSRTTRERGTRQRRTGWFGGEVPRALGLVAIGVFLNVMFVHDIYQGRGVQHKLAARGVSVEASVSGLYYGRYGLDRIDVTFDVEGEPVQHELELFGGVPSGLSQGSPLAVVFDPQRPADVMLRSQIHGGTGSVIFFLFAGLVFLLAGCRALWLAIRRPGESTSMQPARLGWSLN